MYIVKTRTKEIKKERKKKRKREGEREKGEGEEIIIIKRQKDHGLHLEVQEPVGRMTKGI